MPNPAASSGSRTRPSRKPILRRALLQPSTRLPHHGRGPGRRYVFFDSSHTPGAGLYAIARCVAGLRRPPEPYVEEHAHRVASYYLFLGSSRDPSGLHAEVTLGRAVRHVRSPSAVFIPPALPHSVRLTKGTGSFVHILLEEDYEKGLVAKAR